jgi:type I restriction enzyme S subunit
MKLAPYPDYKDSGVLWLGKIPAHWDCLPHRAVFSEVKDQGHIDEPLLSVTITKGIIPQSQLLANSSKKDSSNLDKSKYKLVCPNDIAYNKMRAWQGAIGVSMYRGIVSPAYIVVRLRRPDNPNYFHYLLRTPSFTKEAERWSYGITPDMWSLRPEHFKLIYSCIPQNEEQTQIARFLNWKTAQINKFIRNKRRLIELLKEQKQNVISQAVSRGLDPKVKFKPSGVEWIGDIPEHWKMVPLKRLASFKGGTGFPHEAQGRSGLELPFYKVSDMTLSGNETYMVNTNNSISRETASSLGATIFPERAIIFPKVGGAMLTNKRRILTKPSCIDNNMMACVLNSETIFDFLFLRLQTLDLGLIRKPGPVPAIGEGEVRAFRVPYPPEEEQFEIVEYVKAQTSAIDQTITRAQREIELMREYRTRLISDVVTGQVDVRGIEVPDVAEDELLALEEDTIDADDVIDDEGEMDETD